MNDDKKKEHDLQLAEFVRAECIKAALEGYENAAASGLCHEGAWESAIDSIRSLNISKLLSEYNEDLSSGAQQGIIY